MQIKLSKSDGHVLAVATRAMDASGIEENKHKKAREAAKVIIDRELIRLRGIHHADLADKEVVLVDVDGAPVLKIERKSSQRLDQAGLKAAHPDIADEFMKDSVASYFSSLLK